MKIYFQKGKVTGVMSYFHLSRGGSGFKKFYCNFISILTLITIYVKSYASFSEILVESSKVLSFFLEKIDLMFKICFGIFPIQITIFIKCR